MGMFNMFGDSEHRVFNYKPRYFDPEEERRRRLFGDVDGSNQKKAYEPGSQLRGSFRSGAYKKEKSHSNPVQNFIGIVGLVLVFIILFYIAKFYTIL